MREVDGSSSHCRPPSWPPTPQDIQRSVAELQAEGVEFTKGVSDEGFGLMTSLRLPGGGELSLYEPKHPIPHWPRR